MYQGLRLFLNPHGFAAVALALTLGLFAKPMHAALGDGQWSPGWGRSGANNTVESVGSFGTDIARWDGTAWSEMGSGLDDRAEVLGTFGGALFVGGEFATAGLGAGAHIARWTPVPEPAFALMLGLGLWRFRCRRSAEADCVRNPKSIEPRSVGAAASESYSCEWREA